MVRQNGIFYLALVVSAISVSAVLDAGERQATRLYSIGIKGMTCEACSVHIQKELAKIPGVVESSVDYKAGHAWVTAQKSLQQAVGTAKPRQINTELAAAVKRAGYVPTVNYVLSIKGMTCEACSKHIASAITKVPGVATATVNFKGGYAIVVPTAKAGSISKSLVAAVEKAGYKALAHTGP